MSFADMVHRLTRMTARRARLWTSLLFWSLCFRVAIKLLPFSWIASSLGLVQLPPEQVVATDPVPRSTPAIREVADCCRRLQAATPRLTTCLSQSLTAHQLLKRQATTCLVLGLRHDEAGKLVAHSWLNAGGRVVTGGPSVEGYTPLAAYVAAPATR